jgi:hypothetical protein
VSFGFTAKQARRRVHELKLKTSGGACVRFDALRCARKM